MCTTRRNFYWSNLSFIFIHFIDQIYHLSVSSHLFAWFWFCLARNVQWSSRVHCLLDRFSPLRPSYVHVSSQTLLELSQTTRQKSGALEVRDLSEDFILGHRGNLLKVGSLFSEIIDPSMEPFRAKYVDGSRPLWVLLSKLAWRLSTTWPTTTTM